LNADELWSVQAPLKDRYRENPETVLITLRAHGPLGEGLAAKSKPGRRWLHARG
jgi:hypothetical protein